MKAVPKIGLDGLYIEDAIVDDTFSGVVPFYADPPELDPDLSPETDAEAVDEQPEEGEREIAGYIVGVPAPSGLYLPRFDLSAWQKYQDDTTEEQPEFWSEGLAQEEIDELPKLKPQEPTPTDLLGAELTAIKLQNIEQQAVVSSLGSELTAARLNSIQQQQTISALGAELTAAKLELIKLKGVDQV
ncbi:hypothetical protein [Paenibacillus macerans]|uniref:hypothetical protein n=1 Tax=Paenibacillus macerans TaxID=44252 RepID=UPI001E37289D|nr:hypothetical protein [Paenibacillus macerans]